MPNYLFIQISQQEIKIYHFTSWFRQLSNKKIKRKPKPVVNSSTVWLPWFNMFTFYSHSSLLHLTIAADGTYEDDFENDSDNKNGDTNAHRSE